MNTDDLRQDFTNDLSELVHEYQAAGLENGQIADKLVLYAEVAKSESEHSIDSDPGVLIADD
jgi:hypothetical protein